MSERTHIDEAARWFLRLQEDSANAQTFLEWQRWLNAAPEHRIAYDEIEETILQLRVPTSPPLPSPEQMAQDDYDGSMPIADWNRSRSAGQRPRPHVWYGLAASVALVLGTAGFFFHAHHQARHGEFDYQTNFGERREYTLPEGSHITLDAKSDIRIELTPTRRSMKLVRGEAYFKVAKDAARPFTVHAGAAAVVAVGTAFNVRLTDDRTVVAVSEGKVEVTAAPLVSLTNNAAPTTQLPNTIKQPVAAGQAVAYSNAGRIESLPDANASLATSWLEGRRQYRDEPLRYVLADINRYTGRHLTVEDPSTAELKFTGTVDLQNIDGWVKALGLALPVHVKDVQDGGA
jgi:transmembrane sensor